MDRSMLKPDCPINCAVCAEMDEEEEAMGLTMVVIFNDRTRKYDVTINLKYHLLNVPPKNLGEAVDGVARMWNLDPELRKLEEMATGCAGGFYKA